MNENKFVAAMQEWSGVFARRTIHDFMGFTHENNISWPQVNVLMRLYYRGPTSILAVRQELYSSRSAASQLIDKLVQLVLVERSEDSGDRRVKNIRLTEPGRRLVEQGIAARRRWLAELAQALSPQEQEQYAVMLIRLSHAGQALETREEVSRAAHGAQQEDSLS